MANICFLTFYDEICIGPRLMSSILKRKGHKASLIIFKGEKYDEIIAEGREDLKCYAYYREGILRGSLYDIDKWTANDEECLVSLLSRLSPDILAISTRSFWADLGKQLSSKIRQKFPGMPIIAGGWGPSLEPERFLEFSDYVFFGEGVRVIEDIAETCDSGGDLSSLRNAVFKRNGKLVKNTAYDQLEDLNILPFPDFDTDDKYLITDGRAKTGDEFYNPKMYDVYATQGCPLACSYCMSSKWQKVYKDEYGICTRKTRLRGVDHVIQELKQAKERGASYIRIKDEVYPWKRDWLRQFIGIYRSEIGLPFCGYLRPEFHNAETIRQLREAGFVYTTVGIQSGSRHILRDIYNRRYNLDAMRQFTETLKALDINFEYHLIGFCRAEQEEHMKETLEYLYKLPYGHMKVFKIKYFPKAPITEMIGDIKQTEEKDILDSWYARLYTMAVKGPDWRELARTIHKTQMFKTTPWVLQNLFIPEMEKERQLLSRQKETFRAKSFSIPENLVK